MSVSLLDSAKANGGDDAMSSYDNICSYMLIVGKICNQTSEYWKSLLSYCKEIERDGEEVANCIQFLMRECDGNLLNTLHKEVADTIIRLFFGQFYSAIKNEPSNLETVEEIRVFLKRPTLLTKVQ